MGLSKMKYIATVLALIACVSAFLLPLSIYADTDYDSVPVISIDKSADGSMLVNASWVDDEMLRIDVVDLDTGAVSSLAIRLCDFITDYGNSPYVLVQAADLDGNISGAVQISNPFYSKATKETTIQTNEAGTDLENVYADTSYRDTSPTPLGLTPDGTGTVVDNVVTQNDIEFFTVFTEEGNVFFLVVDRQSSTDNVYLLNAVTEADLMALAERSGNPIEDSSVSVIPPLPEPPVELLQEEPSQSSELEPLSTSSRNSNGFMVILIVALLAGGAVYYVKVILPKKNSNFEDDDFDVDDYDEFDDTEYIEDEFDDFDINVRGDE